MRGYEVVTSDDRVVGQVVDVRDGFLIVESGHLRKSRHPVPREFVHVVDEAAKAFVTVPKRVLMEAPPYSAAGNPRRTKPSGSLAVWRSSSSASVASRWRFHIWA